MDLLFSIFTRPVIRNSTTFVELWRVWASVGVGVGE